MLEVDDAGPDLLVLRRRFLGEDANAVRYEDGAPQRLEGVARLLRAVEYDLPADPPGPLRVLPRRGAQRQKEARDDAPHRGV